MSSIKRTFAESLSHFVRSIDIVDDSTKESVLSVICGYLEDELDIRYFTLYVEAPIDRERGLNPTEWSRGGNVCSFTIKDDSQNYRGQVPLAYDRDISLWIVNADKGTLKSASRYVDLSEKADSDEIPNYVKNTEYEIYTSIIRPTRDGSRIYGVVNFESTRYLPYSRTIETELRKISELISTLYILNKAYKNQRQNTAKEIEYLRELKNEKSFFSRLEKPTIFIASSNHAEDDVISAIKEILQEYEKEFLAVHWKDISDSGIVTQQIVKEIENCRYGICYLSEPVDLEQGLSSESDKPQYRYRDNPNVLIEAGMLSASSHGATFDRWIPVREEDSAPLPFDFMGNRTVVVSRSDQKLSTEKLRVELRKTIDSWIASAS